MPGRFSAYIAAALKAGSGRFLLLHRAADKDYAPGLWECVTGRLEQGETFTEALKREIAEETGFAVEKAALLGTSHFFRGRESSENEHLGVLYLVSIAEETDPRLSDEHDACRWVAYDEIRSMLETDSARVRWLLEIMRRAQLVDADELKPVDRLEI